MRVIGKFLWELIRFTRRDYFGDSLFGSNFPKSAILGVKNEIFRKSRKSYRKLVTLFLKSLNSNMCYF